MSRKLLTHRPMDAPASRRWRFAVAIFSAISLCATALPAETNEEIDLSTLPDPPAEIAQWIDQWNVTLTTGERPPDHPANLRGLAADTDFQVAFDYRFRSKWQTDTQNGTVRIQVSFLRVDWKPKHTIWLRHPPQAESFWDHPLVLHEFDHVQISGDPRIEKLFRQKLRDQNVITAPIESGQVVNEQVVEKLVDERVSEVFKQIHDLIALRYRELDRVTAHGRREIPDDSIIHQWLGTPETESSPSRR